MDETARESVAGFIKSLRNNPDSLHVSEELLKQIQSPMETEITRQNLKDLITLAQLGIDVEFIGEIDASLKPYIPLKYSQYGFFLVLLTWTDFQRNKDNFKTYLISR